MKYTIEHRLHPNKPIRRIYEPYEVIVFDNIKDAEELLKIKNKISGAGFYKIVEVKNEEK
jgi:hypothetical protein